ncbi:MAG: hypothetical protein V1859_02645 [archaeon]
MCCFKKKRSKLNNDKESCISELARNKQVDLITLEKSIEELHSKLKEIRLNNSLFIEKESLAKRTIEKKEALEKSSREMESISKEAGALEASIKSLSESLLDYSNTIEKIESISNALQKLSIDENRLHASTAALVNEKGMLEKQNKAILSEIEQKEAIKAELAYLNDVRAWLSEFFIKLSETMEKHILSSIYYEFNSLFKEWFSILIEEGIEVAIDDEFSLRIFQDGFEASYDNLSGGEKTAVALAYRLALNKVISCLVSKVRTKDLIILDEPTYGFSSQQLDRVREVFLRLDAKQVIIVSHEQKMEGFVEKVLKVTKDAGVSKVTVQ